MKLSEFRKDFDYYSGKASDNVRQLAFAGIAVAWIFRQGSDGIKLSTPLVWAIFLFIVALGLDLLHYVVGARIWRKFVEDEEKKIPDDAEGEANDPDIEADPNLNKPLFGFYNAKIGAIFFGYLFLLYFLARTAVS